MKKILVPTDFSDAAYNAAEYAANLSKDMNASITLFHVYHFPIVVSEVPVMVVTPDELEKQNEVLLTSLVNKLKEKTGVNASYNYVMGLAVDEIITEAQKYDLIIMGMKGAGLLSEALLGSIATATIKETQTPVLVIPNRATYQKPEKIVFASDSFPEKNINTIEILKNLATTFHSKIYVVNVKQKKESVALDTGLPENKTATSPNDIEHVYYFSEKESLAEGINEFAEQHHADMIAVIPHHYNLLERMFHTSISKKMAFHSSVPLLTIPEIQ